LETFLEQRWRTIKASISLYYVQIFSKVILFTCRKLRNHVKAECRWRTVGNAATKHAHRSLNACQLKRVFFLPIYWDMSPVYNNTPSNAGGTR
jgi:hypothetical protein